MVIRLLSLVLLGGTLFAQQAPTQTTTLPALYSVSIGGAYEQGGRGSGFVDFSSRIGQSPLSTAITFSVTPQTTQVTAGFTYMFIQTGSWRLFGNGQTGSSPFTGGGTVEYVFKNGLFIFGGVHLDTASGTHAVGVLGLGKSF